MRWRDPVCGLFALALLGACAAMATTGPDTVELTVAGPPIAPEATGQHYVYRLPDPVADGQGDGGRAGQQWSFLGREDRAAPVHGDYRAAACPPAPAGAAGQAAVLDAIVARAREARIVILNESHAVTRHRAFSQALLARLRPLGYSVFAAETFNNRRDEPDPVEEYAALPYPHRDLGWYSREPVFGRLVREAMGLGYRLAAYEQVHDAETRAARDENDWVANINAREAAQATHLAALLETMAPDEKLFIHVGYDHAEEVARIEEGRELAWMALRLRRLTGIDPLTIAQTECRGGADTVRLASPATAGRPSPFDLLVDHPLETFRAGRPEWRLAAGHRLVPIPPQYAQSDTPLVIEAFAEGEPFDAVPIDRVYVEPGEDVRLALPPGRYTVRAVRVGR